MTANRLRKRHEVTRRGLKREAVLAATRSDHLSDCNALANTDCRKTLRHDPLHRFLASRDLLHDRWRRALEQRFTVFVKEVEPDSLFALQIVEVRAKFVRPFSFIHARR